MRPQQKSFVVEIKSKGRLSTARQGSIWGTADLKAIALQAANIAPQLFETADTVVETVTEEAALFRDVAPSVDPSVAREDDEPSAIDIPSAAAVAIETDLPEAVRSSVPMDTQHESTAAVAAPRTGKPSRLKQASIKPLTSAQPAIPDVVATDDLVRLEIENARLKSLWGAHLLRQNEQLRAMLDRFTAL